MDLEQLKLILEAVSNAGDGAKEFGIWYLIATALPDIVTSVCKATALIVVAYLAASVFRQYLNDELLKLERQTKDLPDES